MSDTHARSGNQQAAAQNSLQRTPDSIPDFWRFYEEHAAQARQHETLRASVASILGGIAAAVVAFAASDGLTGTDALAGIVVITLGILGAALSIKHYERNRMHTTILKEIRSEITCLQQDPDRAPRTTDDIRKAAVEKHKEKFALFERKSDRRLRPRGTSPWVGVRLHHLWISLNLSIALVGLLLIIGSRFWR
jgi:hypothetical protein